MDGSYFNSSKFLTAFPALLKYLPFTLIIVLLSVVFALLGGFLLTYLQLRKNKIISTVTKGIVSIIRGTPLIILLFIVYYGSPHLMAMWGIDISDIGPERFAIITFSVSLSAFISEIMKAAYRSIDKGQIEAGVSMGIPRYRVLTRVVIPQAVIMQLPNIGNLIITAIKQSSIMFTIGIMDIYQKAESMSADSSGAWQLEIFLALMFIYWGVAIIIDKLLAVVYSRQKVKLS